MTAGPDPLTKLTPSARNRVGGLLDLLASDPTAPSAVRERERAWTTHVADSLTGLEVAALERAETIADVGAGAGFPGLVLAVAVPTARVDLVESVGRKCAFIRRAIEAMEIENARVVCDRAETWSETPPPSGGREAYAAVTARAVGRLATLAELASPLLRPAGVLIAWKGRRDPEEEAELVRAATETAMEAGEILAVGEVAGSRHRHLHAIHKAGPTPARLPRRPGMAKKRPFGRAA